MSKFFVPNLLVVSISALAATSAAAQSGVITITQEPSGAMFVEADRMVIDANGNVEAQSGMSVPAPSNDTIEITADKVTIAADGNVLFTGNPRLSRVAQPTVAGITSNGVPMSLASAQALSNARQIERVEVRSGTATIDIVRKEQKTSPLLP